MLIGFLILFISTPIRKAFPDPWFKAPTYMQMSDATFKIAPEYKFSHKLKPSFGRAYIPTKPNETGTPFKLYRIAEFFTFVCRKDFTCFPHLKEYERPNFYISYFDSETKIDDETILERTKSFDRNFDYTSSVASKRDFKNEFSLISKEPLYLDFYVVVSCRQSKPPRVSSDSQTCYFQSIKNQDETISDTFASMPMLRFTLEGLEVNSEILKGHKPELWPEIIKGFEQFISDIQVPSLEVERIERLAEGHWKKQY